MEAPEHPCRAHGCDEAVPARSLMCRHHWSLVPQRIQLLVWRHYVDGLDSSGRPTAAYRAVLRLAVALVADREGHHDVAMRFAGEANRWVDVVGDRGFEDEMVAIVRKVSRA